MKITIENQLRAWLFHILGSAMMLGCLWYLNFDPIFAVVFGIYWLIYTIPALALYIEYLIINKGQEIEIGQNKLIVNNSNGETRSYEIKDLDKIIVYKSASMDKGGIPLLSSESFYYARIKAKSGLDIIITCLMSHDVDKVVRKLSGVSYERRKTLFAFIFLG